MESKISKTAVQPSCSKQYRNSLVQSSILSTFQDRGKINTEVRWSLKQACSSRLQNSVCGSFDLFEVMFPDRNIASQMEFGRMKLMYTVNFGITPYFRKILNNEIVNSEWYTISFDESLNKVVQECKMDVIIRFLYNLSNKVQVRVWNSMFFWAQYLQIF